MGQTFFFQWEIDLIVWIQAHLGTAGAVLANFASMLGEETIAILLLGVFYWGINKQLGLSIGLNTGMAGLWGSMLKNVAMRRRPYFDHPAIRCLRPIASGEELYSIKAQGYSFPSMHSSNAAAAYGTMAVHSEKAWVKVLCVLLALLVGVSRFCVGVHYPTDVLAGWLLAALTIALIMLMERKIARKQTRYAILLLTAVPGIFFCQTNDFFTCFGVAAGLMLGNLFEEKVVHFKETRNLTAIILRVLGGLVMYLALNQLFKLPFSAEFLESATRASLLFRLLRYLVITFLGVGVYPMVFKRIPLMKG